jgi:hypothetical protein
MVGVTSRSADRRTAATGSGVRAGSSPSATSRPDWLLLVMSPSGLLSVGGVALGLVAVGALAVGLVAVGAVSIGLMAVGGVTIGLTAMGMATAGLVAGPRTATERRLSGDHRAEDRGGA